VPALTKFLNQIICGPAEQVLKKFPSESIDCVVTSPPYWALRDYGVVGQLGRESTISLYITKLADVFDEVKRVLKQPGTCWIIMGDSYYSNKVATATKKELPVKSICQIPARLAIELGNRGWILRNEIIWHKPNCMPESVKDRFTVDFEKLFFFVKNRTYYFKQQFEALRDPARLARRFLNPGNVRKRKHGDQLISAFNPKTAEASRLRILKSGRNKRSVWSIPTQPSLFPHYAAYPASLIETPIRAGCPARGVVLDPFIGSGTTALVASRLGRNFIGIDLNPEYVQMSVNRLKNLNDVAAISKTVRL